MTNANNIPAYAALSVLNTKSGKQDEKGHIYEGVILNGEKVNLELLDKTSNSETGYQGYAYRNMTTNEIYVVHEGSQPPEFSKEAYNDWINNDANMVLNGNLPPQFNDAKSFLDGIKSNNQNVQITQIGQSLGGSLAIKNSFTSNEGLKNFKLSDGTILNRDQMLQIGNTQTQTVSPTIQTMIFQEDANSANNYSNLTASDYDINKIIQDMIAHNTTEDVVISYSDNVNQEKELMTLVNSSM